MVRGLVNGEKNTVSHTPAHASVFWLKNQKFHSTNAKTLEEMFHRATYRFQEGAVQSSLDVSDHPEITSKPKYGWSLGDVYVYSVLSRILLMIAAMTCQNMWEIY